jgi:hypothetical protein
MIGDAARRGLRAGINRIGEEKAAIVVDCVSWERAIARTCVGQAQRRLGCLQWRKERVVMLFVTVSVSS